MLVILIHTQTNVILSKPEVIDYELRFLFEKKVRLDCNLLHFWKMSVDLPLVRSLAKKCIPINSATSERDSFIQYLGQK